MRANRASSTASTEQAFEQLAELPRGTGVLEQDVVGVERIQFAFTEAIDRCGRVCDELGELRFVIGRYRLACSLTF